MTTLRSEEVAMSHHDDNPEKMARMRDWLEIAAREVDVDPSVLRMLSSLCLTWSQLSRTDRPVREPR